MRIVFIGGGNMASAMIGGLVAKGHAARDIRVVEPLAEARARLAREYGVHGIERLESAPAADEVVIFAVKPQQIGEAARACGLRRNANLVISIAAGVRLATLSRRLGGHTRLVRAMPNTPALIGAGIAGLYALPEVSAEERERAATILGAVGTVVWVEEERLLDPVTAVSGSGPAYVFWFIEQLAASGAALGLAPDTARKLALETVLGAAKLAASSGEPPGVLRERVTSKGGTTEAALRVFAEEKLAERLARAVEAASRRGAELGKLLDEGD
jgi:pyrroline-5-carboxylate reductase